MIPEGKLANPTIFIRPDLEILSSLDFQLYFDLLQYKPISTSQGEADGVALLPSWHSWSGLNDRFAICSSGNSSVAYATRFDSLLPYLQISRHPIHPETFLFHVMHASLVACYPVIYPYMSRIRASGRSQPEDFSKGQSSFDLQSQTLHSLYSILNEMNSKVRSYESHLDNLEVKLSDKLHELQKLQEHHKTLLDEKVVLRARSNDLNKTLSEKNCEIQVLVEEAGSYAAKVSDVKNKLSEKIESLRQLEEHNKRLCKENAVFEEDNKRLCKENAVFEEDNKRLCKENAVFEDSLSLLNDEVERQRVSYSDLKVQSDAIEVELKQVKDQNFSMATLIEQLEYQQKL